MKAIQLAEHASPLDAQQAQQFNSLIETLTPLQGTWISGYLAGISAAAMQEDIPAGQQPQAAPQNVASETLTILYGSQTGNAEGLAALLGEQAEAQGLTVRVVDMLDYKPKDLKKETHIAVVVSTQGEGDPPDNAEELYEFLHGKKAPKLDGLKFSVLALGDTSYESYCQIGREFDERLQALGGQRVFDRADLDVDYEDDAQVWIDKALVAYADELAGGERHPTVTPMPARPAAASGSAQAGQWSRKNPFAAEVLDNIVLNARGSAKEVRHIELDTEDSGLVWEPGDALGIIPENNARVVDDLITALGLDAEDTVSGVDGDVTLRHALTHQYEITTLTRPLIEKYAQLAESDELNALLAEDRRAELTEYIEGRFIVDLVEQFPVPSLTGSDLVGLLRKLPPRLYSIASSHAANPDELHLTVAAVRYEAHGRDREGVASIQLADRSDASKLPIYIDRNKNFKLPDDNSAPIIMVGPGTGVAPFRAFMEEREERDADGRNWLLFGAQHFRADFYYQTDWLRWRKDGLLTRMDAAFSRDQAEKVYVQDKLRAAGAELYEWLEQGAYVYVCGDANAMARDVHDTLLDVIGEHGGLDAEAAAGYLKQMQKDKRYQRDVY